MFDWFDEGEDCDEPSEDEAGLISCRTEDKTKRQYRSKVNVLCTIVQDSRRTLKKTYGHLVREKGDAKAFNMDKVKRLEGQQQRSLWTKLLNIIAEDPQYAKSQVCRRFN